MLKKEEFNNYLEKIVSINNEGIKQKRIKLEAFTKQEQLIREYHLALSEFEKAQSDVSLKNFHTLYNKIINDLYNFNPYDVIENINKIYKHIDYINKYKENLLFVSSQINQIVKKWHTFLSKNEQFINSQLNVNFNELLEEIEETMSESGINNVAAINFKLENLNDRVDKNLGIIGTLNKFKNFYMFQGEEAKRIEKELNNLINITPDKTEGDFMEQSVIIIKVINKKIKSSKTGILGIPVIVAKNIKDKHIKRYTLKFKNFILKEDPFFNSKGVEFLNTNEYFYIDNVPKEGIYEGKKIIEGINVADNYANAVNEYISASSKNFYILLGIFVFLGFSSIAISNIIVSIIFALLTFGGYFLFSVHLNALKENVEEKYNIKNMFLYKSLDMVIYDKGYDVNTEELIDWIIFRLDDTLYNQENMKAGDLIWLEN